MGMEQNTVIQLFLALGIILVSAKTAGYISRLLHQPAVLGELLIGVILGPSLINMLNSSLFTDTHLAETIKHIAELGVLLLMFGAGMEINLQELKKVGKVAVYSGTVGVFAPLLMAMVFALLAGYPLETSAFLGITLAATSVSISAQVMLELNVLHSREGLALLGAAVVDDVLAILLLSILLSLSAVSGGIGALLSVLIKMLLYFIIAGAIGWLILPRLARYVSKLPISSGNLAFAVALALLFGWAAEAFGGVAAITGAFIAGVALSRAEREIKHDIEKGLHSLNYGLLVPVFFVSIGLQTNLRALRPSDLPFALVLLVIAIVSKILGGGLGARLGGFDNIGARRVGIGMISRGEVGLIIGSIGLTSGLLSAEIFPQIVLIVIATTLITPPLVRWSFSQQATPKAKGA
jgi:Kef-type K+ transport system membrane component KefB